MGKLIMTVTVDFDTEDESLDLSIETDVAGHLSHVESAIGLFFKKALEYQAEHAANQAVDYGSIVRAAIRAAEGDDWED